MRAAVVDDVMVNTHVQRSIVSPHTLVTHVVYPVVPPLLRAVMRLAERVGMRV
jgi:hypothetical protein